MSMYYSILIPMLDATLIAVYLSTASIVLKRNLVLLHRIGTIFFYNSYACYCKQDYYCN